VQENEIRYQEYYLDDAEITVVGFGTAGRIALSAVRNARLQGVKAGLFRPISLNPFPIDELEKISQHTKKLLVVEMNTGQMLNDVQRAVKGKSRLIFTPG